MTDFKAHACLGLMYWYFQAENEEEAQKLAEAHFEEIRRELAEKYHTSIQSGQVSIIRGTANNDDRI